MNIQEALRQIETAYRAYTARGANGLPLIPPEAQRPLFLIGPPGVGKTEIVKQAAERLGVGLASYTLTHHTRQSALGLPRIVERRFGDRLCAFTEYTMSEIIAGVYGQMEATGATGGILFLDEINCVSETLTPALLELLQHKRFGQYAVPEGWMIVCAGNPEAFNRSARAFDPVTLDRLRTLNIQPEIAPWLTYAAEMGVHPAVRGYLRLQPEDFCFIRGEKMVTPRAWTDLSQMMHAMEELGEIPGENLFEQYLLSPETAERFKIYFALCRGVAEHFSLDAVLEGRNPAAEAHFAHGPFEEGLSAAMILANGLNVRAREQARAEETSNRLESFVSGALRAEGDKIKACTEQFARMERAMEARRGAGVLSPEAENSDRALFRAARSAMAAGAGKENVEAALMDYVNRARDTALSGRGALKRAFENGFAFAGHAFLNPRLKIIFHTEIQRAPASLDFLKKEMPDVYKDILSENDIEKRAEELRAKLKKE